MTTLKEDISKAYFDSKDLQETINKTTLRGWHDHDYELKTLFRKHEGTTIEDDVIGDVVDDLVETIERISTKVDEILMKKKVYMRRVLEDGGWTTTFGLEEDVLQWKYEQEEWEKDGQYCGDDSIEEIGNTEDIGNLLGAINSKISEWVSK